MLIFCVDKLGMEDIRTEMRQSYPDDSVILRQNAMSSVATVITDVFRKKRINVSNKFVRIMKIFTKINDLKTMGSFKGPKESTHFFPCY